ncbi:MAG: pilus assembly protein N-terminal domain-containing protein [Candidatus Omnitrophica bacterium]|nr:pilus assembly protein N-terminal domain-containing protein [Candidatus Omnitrophota bacterium]
MLGKFRFYLILILLIFSFVDNGYSTEYSMAYSYCLQKGKSAFGRKDYNSAIRYFSEAQLVEPSTTEPKEYINLIKRLQDHKVVVISSDKAESSDAPPSLDYLIVPHAPIKNKISREQKVQQALQTVEQKTKPFNRLDLINQSLNEAEGEQTAVSLENFPAQTTNTQPILDVPSQSVGLNEGRQAKELPAPKVKPSSTLKLNDEAWKHQPNAPLRLSFRTAILIEGKNIDKFLVVSPGSLEIERIDRDQILVKAVSLGTTIVYVWDNKGRWSFDVNVIVPLDRNSMALQREQIFQIAKPFRVGSSVDWSSIYSGPSYSNLRKLNLGIIYNVNVVGEVPVGKFDSSLTMEKFADKTPPTYYTVGLTDARIYPFEKLELRGYDAMTTFSPLTVTGENYRGLTGKGEILHKTIGLTSFWGREQNSYGLLSSGQASTHPRDAFIEGTRVELFPERDNKLAFNYARGYGLDRDENLKEKVFSLQGQARTFKNVLNEAEVAYDQSRTAHTVKSVYEVDGLKTGVSYRNIQPDFKTITGAPSGQGEVGGLLTLDWTPYTDANWTASLDTFQDRLLPNEENPNGLNYDFNSTLVVPFTTDGTINQAIYFTTTPQQLSPRTNFQYSSTYSKYLPIWGNQKMNAYIQGMYQKSRYSFSDESDYDRYSTTAGMSVPLIKDLTSYTTYQYSWIYNFSTGKFVMPGVLTTGLSYNNQIGDHLNNALDVSYRREQNAAAINSFLAGEDSFNGGITSTYSVSEDFQLYLDGRTRKVWPSIPGGHMYTELDVRGGVKTSLETPFAWTAVGRIEGYVFKDLNSNGSREYNEPGLPNVKIKIGRKQVKTDKNGHYFGKIRAKLVTVSIDVGSLPPGYVLSTPNTKTVNLAAYKTQLLSFGTSTNTSIYGMVFVDENNNGKPDTGEKTIGQVKIFLDGKTTVYSDMEGTYTFQNVLPGNHRLSVDINSIPLDYLPKIKLQKSLTIEEGSTYVFYVPLKGK